MGHTPAQNLPRGIEEQAIAATPAGTSVISMQHSLSPKQQTQAPPSRMKAKRHEPTKNELFYRPHLHGYAGLKSKYARPVADHLQQAKLR